MDVSSVKSLIILLIPLTESLMYMIKYRGAKNEPCGTPVIMGLYLETETINNILLVLYSVNNFPAVLVSFLYFHLPSIILLMPDFVKRLTNVAEYMHKYTVLMK